MNKIFKTIASLIVGASLLVGCATTTTPTVTSSTNTVTGVVSSVTNNVVSVNQANLTLDCSGLQVVTAVGVSVAVQKDPSIVPTLQNVSVALTGILNGANTNSVNQILSVLGTNSNPVIVQNIGPVVNSVSGLEQTLLKKYGATVAGQITIAIVTAFNNGLTAGLQGVK